MLAYQVIFQNRIRTIVVIKFHEMKAVHDISKFHFV
jgi:hypothetical protein